MSKNLFEVKIKGSEFKEIIDLLPKYAIRKISNPELKRFLGRFEDSAFRDLSEDLFTIHHEVL